MEANAYKEDSIIPSLAWQVLNVAPLIQKRLLKLEMDHSEAAIPLSHIQVLAMLTRTGSMSVTDISREFGIAKPNITPLVDRLIDAGYVRRERNTADRRVVNVVILDKGREKLAEIHADICQQIHLWTGAVSTTALTEFSQALYTVGELLSHV